MTARLTLLALLASSSLLMWGCSDDEDDSNNSTTTPTTAPTNAPDDMGGTTTPTEPDMETDMPASQPDAGGDMPAPTIKVALVVRFGDDSTETRCVEAAATSGFDILSATDFTLIVQDTQFGPAVCKIDDDGCPEDNCFACAEAAGATWALFEGDGAGDWTSAQVGIGDLEVADGDIIGLSFTTSDMVTFAPDNPPPTTAFGDVCTE